MEAPPRTPSADRLERYAVIATATDLAPFSLGPDGGFRDGDVAHFLELRCIKCREKTVTDVALYALGEEGDGCTSKYGQRGVLRTCFPKCSNPAHLVRKCKLCERLGSVELIAVGDKITMGRPEVVMQIHCLGYEPMAYSPGPGWVFTNTSGGKMAATNNGRGSFRGTTCTGEFIANVRFEVQWVSA